MKRMVTLTARLRLQIYRDRRKQYRWRLRAGNGRIVAVGESHPRKRDATRAFSRVVSLIVGAVCEGLTVPRRTVRRRT